MWNETIVIGRDFAFLCAFAAVFIFRRRLAQQQHDYMQREWPDRTRDGRELYAQFIGALALLAFLITLVASIYENAT
jgi:hypothetical protein